jgi:hypothetical protein
MGAKVVALQKALVTLLTTIGFDFGMNRQNVFGKVVFSGELMCAHLAFELFPFLMHCKERRKKKCGKSLKKIFYSNMEFLHWRV